MAELICDTSPLIALHQIGLLDILCSLGSPVVVPGAVEQELSAGQSIGHDVPLVTSVDWITIRSPVATPSLPNAFSLGRGELEVLWLTLETPASVAILDDSAARRVAADLGVVYTGTLGLLVDAKRRGIVAAVAPLLDALGSHGFHMSPGIRHKIITAAGEAS